MNERTSLRLGRLLSTPNEMIRLMQRARAAAAATTAEREQPPRPIPLSTEWIWKGHSSATLMTPPTFAGSIDGNMLYGVTRGFWTVIETDFSKFASFDETSGRLVFLSGTPQLRFTSFSDAQWAYPLPDYAIPVYVLEPYYVMQVEVELRRPLADGKKMLTNCHFQQIDSSKRWWIREHANRAHSSHLRSAHYEAQKEFLLSASIKMCSSYMTRIQTNKRTIGYSRQLIMKCGVCRVTL